jgi:hypothetical protein
MPTATVRGRATRAARTSLPATAAGLQRRAKDVPRLADPAASDQAPALRTPDDPRPGAYLVVASDARGRSADGEYFECQIWQRRRQPGRRGRSEDLVALEFAAFRGGLVKLTPDEPVADSTDVAIPRGTLSSTTRMVSDPPVTRRD